MNAAVRNFPIRSRATGHFSGAVLVFLVVASSTLIGVALATDPVFAFLPLSFPLLWGLLVLPEVRATFVVFGGLLTLQSSQSLSAPKLAYLAGSGLALSIAALRARGAKETPWYAALRPLLLLSAAWSAILLLGLFRSVAIGTSISNWIRDSMQYFLFCAAPILAHDVALTRKPKASEWLLASAGVVSAISFSATWVAHRGFAQLRVDHLLYGSILLPLTLIAYSVSMVVLGGRQATVWTALAGFTVFCLLVTGTRTSLLVIPVPFLLVILSNRRSPSSRIRGIALLFGSAILILGLFYLSRALFGIDPGQVSARLNSITQAFGGSNSYQTQSFHGRLQQTSIVWDAFKANPIFGVGPGYAFHYLRPVRHAVVMTVGYDLDSPLITVAKFGLFGLVASLWTLLVFVGLIRNSSRYADEVVNKALFAYLFMIVGYSFILSPYEESGFGLGLVPLLALVFVRWTAPGHSTAESTQSRKTLEEQVAIGKGPRPGQRRSTATPGSSF